MSTPNAMVFAPAPQLTVTVERFGEHDELHVHPGGQGIWQARMLRLLEVPVTLCAALGGETGTRSTSCTGWPSPKGCAPR